MNREEFEKLWDMVAKEEDGMNYVSIDAGLRLAWCGDLKGYEYWMEEYDKVRKIWWKVGEDKNNELSDRLMSHIVFGEITKKELQSKIDLDSEVYE